MHPQDTKCTPSQSKSQFLGQFLLGGLALEVYLDGLWGRRLKKVVNFFGKEKYTPRQNSGYAYASRGLCRKALISAGALFCSPFASADHATAAQQMYTRGSIMWDTTSKYRDISITPPLIFTGDQEVRFLALSFNESQLWAAVVPKHVCAIF